MGLQLAPTTVIVEVVLLLLPPPQAARVIKQHAAARIPKSRTPAPLLDLHDIHALWDHSRHIRAAVEVACVSALLENKIRGLNRNGTVAVALLRCDRLLHGLEVTAKNLLQVGLIRAIPRDPKNVAVGGNKLTNLLSRRNLDLVCDLALGRDAAKGALHVGCVGLHRRDVVTQ